MKNMKVLTFRFWCYFLNNIYLILFSWLNKGSVWYQASSVVLAYPVLCCFGHACSSWFTFVNFFVITPGLFKRSHLLDKVKCFFIFKDIFDFLIIHLFKCLDLFGLSLSFYNQLGNLSALFFAGGGFLFLLFFVVFIL